MVKQWGRYVIEHEPAPAGQDPEHPKLSPVFRNIEARRDFPKIEGVNSLGHLFERSARKFPNRPCIGFRPVKDGKAEPFKFMDYATVMQHVLRCARRLKQTGMKKGDKVGIYGTNCVEWMIALQSLNRSGGVCVPLYDSLGKDAVRFVLEQAEVSTIFTAANKMTLLVKAIQELHQQNDKQVERVIYWGQPKDNDLAAARACCREVHEWREFVDGGKDLATRGNGDDSDADVIDISIDDLSTIMYTSGTTGQPKGVLLTHGNVVYMIASLHKFLEQTGYDADERDSVLSFMPLAHSFERVVEEMILSIGASIGYFQGDVKKLTDDILAMKPTVFVAVPRVLERVYSGAMAKLSHGLAGWVFRLAYNIKLQAMRHGRGARLLDWLVFGRLRARLGNRVRFIISGGAPLPSHVEDFMRVTMCCPVLQGYGLTESTAASFAQAPYMDQWYSVGVPLPGTEMRLEAVPEMNYFPVEKNGEGGGMRGEICLRGPTVFQGYYKMPDKTKEDVDGDGFFHTGDVGELLPSGAVRIIDRKKNIFKLSQGEYIAAEALESSFSKANVVHQIWVYGNSHENQLVAVVVPEKHVLQNWAKNHAPDASFEDLCKRPEAEKFVLDELTKTGKEAELRGFEFVKAVRLEPEEWSVETGMVSPSLKLKRSELQKKYKEQLDAMYKKLHSESRG